jgi:3-hydroxyacyl-[acyl-carrier-protein] dehydratase
MLPPNMPMPIDILSSASHPQPHFEWTIPLEHPSYAGHFIGYPIVPGVLCLDLALAQYAKHTAQSYQLKSISAVKFLAPIFPGDHLSVEYEVKVNTNAVINTNTGFDTDSNTVVFKIFKHSLGQTNIQQVCKAQMTLLPLNAEGSSWRSA